jgi:hypothetical protein
MVRRCTLRSVISQRSRDGALLFRIRIGAVLLNCVQQLFLLSCFAAGNGNDAAQAGCSISSGTRPAPFHTTPESVPGCTMAQQQKHYWRKYEHQTHTSMSIKQYNTIET